MTVRTAAETTQPRRRRLRALLALLASSLLALVLAEVFTRLVWGVPLAEREPLMEARAHPTRGYAMLPDTVHHTYLEEVRVNALGLRGPAHADAGPDDVRVLVTGDSLVYGQGVGEEDTLPRALERALARVAAPGARRVRVWNGGHRAYNTEQELALLDELVPVIRPDVVVFCWFANDVDAVDIPALAARLERSGPIVFDLGGPMTDAARAAWKRKQLLRRSALVMKLHDVHTDLTWPETPPERRDEQWKRLDGSFARLAALAASARFPVLVAVLPLASDVARDDAGASAGARVPAIAAARGLAAIDLLPVLRAQRRADRTLHVLPYDGHYDGRANAAMGEQIAEELVQRFPGCFGR